MSAKSKVTIDTYFFEKLQNHIGGRKPFVLYRNPKKNRIHGLLQQNDNTYTTTDFVENGFVFAPFKTDEPVFIIPKAHAKHYSFFVNEKRSLEPSSVSSIAEAEGQIHYKSMVSEAIKAIAQGGIQKVVLSRKQSFKTNATDLVAVFLSLVSRYSEAFVYYWYHPETGAWIGATPETLLELKNRKILTMSLAGTKAVEADAAPLWTPKEYNEQHLVTMYLESILSTLCKKIVRSRRSSVKSGALWHLCTFIAGDLNKDSSIKDVIKKLHPTPAVCGLPKREAYAYILSKEGYQREYYTGFLGSLKSVKKTKLFVNLRCMSITHDDLNVYAGAGITQESVAESEATEVEHKLKAVIEALG